MRNLTVKKWLALFLKIILAATVVIFLGSESLNFFYFVFPPDQWYLAYTGFGLTMGAMFVYFYLFLFDAETPLQRTIAIVMALAGLAGELASAGFGMQIEAWRKAGYALTESNYNLMILVVRILMLLHGLALGMYWAGDRVIEILEESTGRDINQDGRIGKNARSNNQSQHTPNRTQQPQVRGGGENRHTPRQNQPGASGGQRTDFEIADLERASGMSIDEIVRQYPDKKSFKGFAANQFKYVSGENLHTLWMAADPTSAATVSNNGRR